MQDDCNLAADVLWNTWNNKR